MEARILGLCRGTLHPIYHGRLADLTGSMIRNASFLRRLFLFPPSFPPISGEGGWVLNLTNYASTRSSSSSWIHRGRTQVARSGRDSPGMIYPGPPKAWMGDPMLAFENSWAQFDSSV